MKPPPPLRIHILCFHNLVSWLEPEMQSQKKIKTPVDKALLGLYWGLRLLHFKDIFLFKILLAIDPVSTEVYKRSKSAFRAACSPQICVLGNSVMPDTKRMLSCNPWGHKTAWNRDFLHGKPCPAGRHTLHENWVSCSRWKEVSNPEC